MAKETIRERGQRICAELDLIEVYFPADTDALRKVNDLGVGLVFAMQAGCISALTDDGKEYVDELETGIHELLPEAQRNEANAWILVEKAHGNPVDESIISTAARRFGNGFNLFTKARLLAANGIDWSGACRIAS